ncbi:hypothetical protein L7F22_060844 [Adiantum nelumboides]|nr:hypothetical protein [Adiantum nelumboides]
MGTSDKKQRQDLDVSKRVDKVGDAMNTNGNASLLDRVRGGDASTSSDSDDGEWQKSSSDSDDEYSSASFDADESSGDESESTEGIDEAMLDYMGALEKERENSSSGDEEELKSPKAEEELKSPRAEEELKSPRAVAESDSSEDEVPSRNTIGNVPLKWYKEEQHIGYDLSGRKISKREKKDQLDSFLARSDDSKEWHSLVSINMWAGGHTLQSIWTQSLRVGTRPHSCILNQD